MRRRPRGVRAVGGRASLGRDRTRDGNQITKGLCHAEEAELRPEGREEPPKGSRNRRDGRGQSALCNLALATWRRREVD